MKYSKLPVQTSWWWTNTCSKHVEDYLIWNKLLRKSVHLVGPSCIFANICSAPSCRKGWNLKIIKYIKQFIINYYVMILNIKICNISLHSCLEETYADHMELRPMFVFILHIIWKRIRICNCGGLCFSVALVRERTIPTERPPPVGEVSATFAGRGVSRGQRNGSPRPLNSVF